MATIRRKWRGVRGAFGAVRFSYRTPFPGYSAFYFLVMDQTQDLGDRLTEIGRRDIPAHGLFRIHRLM